MISQLCDRLTCWIGGHDPMLSSRQDGTTCWRCARCFSVAPTFKEMTL